MNSFWENLANGLGAAAYGAHSICLSGDQTLISLYAWMHFLIFASYLVLGSASIYAPAKVFASLPKLMPLYGAFILLCGVNHLTKVAVLFYGIYRLDVVVVAATAGVSLATAFMCARAVLESPRAR